MEEQILSVCRLYDDHHPVTIGYVYKPIGLTLTETISKIENAWDGFMETEPNCDDEFIDYLVEEHEFMDYQFGVIEVHVGS